MVRNVVNKLQIVLTESVRVDLAAGRTHTLGKSDISMHCC